jgi:hypothetical protein
MKGEKRDIETPETDPDGRSNKIARSMRAIMSATRPIFLVSYILIIWRYGWLRGWVAAVCLVLVILIAIVPRLHRLRRRRLTLRSSASRPPLVEISLRDDLRVGLNKLARTANLQPAVAAFNVLDREIPRFDDESEELARAAQANQLIDPTASGTLLVAVTTKMLGRLLLISGATDVDRKLWRSYVNQTASRIIGEAIERQFTLVRSDLVSRPLTT